MLTSVWEEGGDPGPFHQTLFEQVMQAEEMWNFVLAQIKLCLDSDPSS